MQKMNSGTNSGKKVFHCSNPDCGKAFDKPKIILFCPHCYAEVQEEKSACPHFFGHLGQKQDGQGIPPECNECTRTIECLLKKRASSKAVQEIKKWF
jgi:hypothetical protein